MKYFRCFGDLCEYVEKNQEASTIFCITGTIKRKEEFEQTYPDKKEFFVFYLYHKEGKLSIEQQWFERDGEKLACDEPLWYKELRELNEEED